jgi:hypothetical protein
VSSASTRFRIDPSSASASVTAHTTWRHTASASAAASPHPPSTSASADGIAGRQVPAQMWTVLVWVWTSPGADVGQSRRRRGPVPAHTWVARHRIGCEVRAYRADGRCDGRGQLDHRPLLRVTSTGPAKRACFGGRVGGCAHEM